MNTQYMKVNPNELVIDLPVDEAKVGELMESIKAYGLLQSPNVWLSGLRIIDGFHRVVACQRLGLSEIDCIVTDCNEEAFWDARIIAAKPHSSISGERFGAWLMESWRLSEWYELVDYEKVRAEYEAFGLEAREFSFDELERFSSAQKIWQLSFSNKQFSHTEKEEVLSGRHKNKKFFHEKRVFVDRQLSDIEQWFSGKAIKWGIRPEAIKSALLNALGYPSDERVARTHGVYLSDRDISFVARDVIHKTVPFGRVLAERANVEDWVSTIEQTKSPISLEAHMKQSELERHERAEKERISLIEENRESAERHRQWLESPAGKASIRKERLAFIDNQIDFAFAYVQNVDIDGFPEALRRLTSLISVIENKMEEAFPEHIKKTRVNPIIAENIELRKQVEAQGRKIESLERALKSKKAVSARLSDVVASSGHEIEMRN